MVAALVSLMIAAATSTSACVITETADRDSLHVVFSRGMVLIAGMKRTSVCRHADAAFHLAERSFGRFARGVRLSCAA